MQTAALADIFYYYYSQWQNGSLGLDQKKDLVARFERREVAKSLAGLLDEVTRDESLKEPPDLKPR